MTNMKPSNNLLKMNEDRGEWEERRFRVSFAELQRMQLRKLQITLVENMLNMRYSNRQSEGWEKTLREYGGYHRPRTSCMMHIMTESMSLQCKHYRTTTI